MKILKSVTARVLIVVLMVAILGPLFPEGKKASAATPVYTWEKLTVAQVPMYKSKYIRAFSLDSLDTPHGYQYQGISINSQTGELTGNGKLIIPNEPWKSYSYDEITSPTTYQLTSVDITSNGGGNGGNYGFASTRYLYEVILGTGDGKGTSLGYVTSTTSGVYPTNGIQGSYWYEYKGLNTAPSLTITSSGDKTLFNDEGTFSIIGTVTNVDSNNVTISAVVGGVTKSTVIAANTIAKPWTLSWSGAELPVGVYTNPVVTASDGMMSSSANYLGKLSIQAQIYYYWSKFNVAQNKTYYWDNGTQVWGKISVNFPSGMYSGFVADAQLGTAYPNGYPPFYDLYSVGSVGYGMDTYFNTVARYTYLGVHNEGQGTYYYRQDLLKWSGGSTKSAGTLIQANIKATQNTYPIDGVHTDGFWYVRSGTVPNNLPTSTVTQSGDKTINLKQGSDMFTISGTAADGDNETLSITATIGGVAKRVTISNTVVAKPWTLTWRTSDFTTGGTFNNTIITIDDGRGGVTTVTNTGTLTVDKTALFYWDKYSVKQKMVYELTHGTGSSYLVYRFGGLMLYSDYTINRDTGQLGAVGSKYVQAGIYDSYYDSVWNGWDGYTLMRVTYAGVLADPSNNYEPNNAWSYSPMGVKQVPVTGEKLKDAVLQTNLLDLDKTYPDNGIHTDGFWYVKKATNNLTPIITLNSEDRIINGVMTTLSLSGTVLDKNNDNVTISASINGISKSVIVKDTSTVQTWELSWPIENIPDGFYYGFNVTANDGIGGIETVTFTKTILIDTTAPSVPDIQVANGWSKKGKVTIIPGLDAVSGVQLTEYKINDGEWQTYSSSFDIENEGETKVTARSFDKADNMSEEATATVKVDITNPQITITPDKVAWTPDNVDVEIQFIDVHSKINVNERKYKVTSSEEIPKHWDTADADIYHLNLVDEGRWFVHVQTEDNAGNKATAMSKAIEIQRKPAIPDNIRVINLGDHFAEIGWDLPSTSFTDGYQYTLENVTTGKQWIVDYPEQKVRDEELDAGTLYSYRIKLKNHVGESSYSDDLQVLTLPAAVNKLSVRPVERVSSEAVLSFDKVTSADRYHISAEESESHVVTFEKTVTDHSDVAVDSLKPGTQYLIKVIAENASGQGAMSSIGFLSLPGEPGEFKAVQIKENEIDLEWYSSESASKYDLLRDNNSVYEDDQTSYNDKGLESGTNYDYQVSAKNSSGFGAIAYLDKIITLPTQISTVTVSTYETDQLTLEWKDVVGADRYVIQVNGAQEDEVTPGTEKYLIKSLLPGTKYKIEIYPSNRSGSGAISTLFASTLTEQPTGLLTDSITETSATLHWDVVSGADKYRVTIDENEYDVSGTELNILNLIGGKNYTFKVEAGNESGFGKAASSEFLTLPTQPNNIHVNKHTANKVQLGWDAASSAIEYVVTVDDRKMITKTPDAVIDDLKPGQTYTFLVKAVNMTGEGEESAFIWRTVPTELDGSVRVEEVGVSTATLSWDMVQGADQYRIVTPGQRDIITTELKVTIEGLESAKLYDKVTLVPLNATGDGTETLVDSFVTLPSIGLKVETTPKQNEIIYHFELPSPNEIVVITKDGKEVYRGHDKEFSLGGLEAGKKITVEIWTENSVGNQSPIQTITVKTLDAPIDSIPGSGNQDSGNQLEKDKDGKDDPTKDDKANKPDKTTETGNNNHNDVFVDIDNLYNKGQVMALFKKGIIKGVNEDHFEPNRDITRAEFAVLIVRALELQPSDSRDMAFEDINQKAWYYKDLTTAYSHGVIDGFSKYKFGPELTISREQASKMLANVLQVRDNAEGVVFKDQKQIAAWAENSVKALVEKSIVEGYPDGTFRPKNSIVRSESASLIYKTIIK